MSNVFGFMWLVKMSCLMSETVQDSLAAEATIFSSACLPLVSSGTKCTEILIREKCLSTTSLDMKRTFLLFCFLNTLLGKSSKKGLCIPPGENFHCGDLAAFKNVRWVLQFTLPDNHWHIYVKTLSLSMLSRLAGT